MRFSTSKTCVSVLPGAVVATALMTVCAAASALPAFSFDPAAAGLAGTMIDADNILVSSFAAVTIDPGGTFTQTGYLPVTGFQMMGSSFTPSGLNTDYGLYIAFSGSGTTTTNDPTATFNFGNFTSLTYTLYGYNGSATFGFSGNTATETASGEVALASGMLISGTVSTVPTGGGGFSPSANAMLTVTLDTPAFFGAPDPFHAVALTAFTNTSSQVEPFAGGFRIRQGGGSLNFAPVPEPSSIALMVGGLAAVGFLYRRRQGAQRWH
ncbi:MULTISPECIES: flocculation-associated PEP-CTERM protein PepA [unclassified Roseateles]|uniref:flocculation-associated PEP-CTERM protein PepA n=1 Tax=unclassified Roseateles TaxID=2626991 RepID=UPI00138F793A|nr:MULTISPECIES: flocculation-associated PEP-CTERM protein PepA [unclassified Roseateles]